MTMIRDDLPDRRYLPGGAAPGGMRNHNERLVLSTIQQNGPMASADIARFTGFSAQTASVITRSLESDGLLRKGDPQRGKVGKPLTPMQLDGDGAFSLGLRVGRRSADLVLVDLVGQVRAWRNVFYPYPTPDSLTAFVREATKGLTDSLTPPQRDRIMGVGIAVPYAIWDWLEWVNAPADQMEAWKAFEIASVFAGLIDLPVTVGNDATLACCGEHVFGLDQALRDFAYFFIGSFIGGGLVLGGRVIWGAGGNAGAFGSIPVRDVREPVHQLLQTASLHVLERSLEKAGIDARSMWDRSQDWDAFEPDLTAWLHTTADELCHAIIAVAAVVDIPVVVIDGNFPNAVRARLTARIAAQLALIDTRGIAKPHIQAGRLGPVAGALGAAYQPLAAALMIDGSPLY